jgi:glutamyl-tRNA synthetase/nondiscriminating glutamyl-tRNA synthetase
VFAHVSLVMGPDHSPLSKRHGATSVREFRERGYLPEALTNYLALIGWSPGEGDELLPLSELAQRFALEDVGRSAGVFDSEKLAWANRHYLKLADPTRLAKLAAPYLERAGWVTNAGDTAMSFLARAVPLGAAAVDRLEQVPDRLRFLFEYSVDRALSDPAIRAEAEASASVIGALASELQEAPPLLDREAFRAAATRVRERTGQKGKALFHPIRIALTGETEGMELDLAVPIIEEGARLRESGLVRIPSAAERAALFAARLSSR